MMKPILFNAIMVRAIKAGTKSVTRRIVKAPVLYKVNEPPTLIYRDGELFQFQWRTGKTAGGFCIKPPYLAGDTLYVRETWTKAGGKYWYRADGDYGLFERWYPSIHMPKEAARLFLRVTDVRVERLQEIMNDPPGPKNQIVREGCSYGCDFIAVWDRTIKPTDKNCYGWDANPWVWVIEFERCEKPEEKKESRPG